MIKKTLEVKKHVLNRVFECKQCVCGLNFTLELFIIQKYKSYRIEYQSIIKSYQHYYVDCQQIKEAALLRQPPFSAKT